jgi:hypothetical protein
MGLIENDFRETALQAMHAAWHLRGKTRHLIGRCDSFRRPQGPDITYRSPRMSDLGQEDQVTFRLTLVEYYIARAASRPRIEAAISFVNQSGGFRRSVRPESRHYDSTWFVLRQMRTAIGKLKTA